MSPQAPSDFMIAAGRAMALARMTDTCQITPPRSLAGDTLDPVTLQLTPPDTAVLYEGPCRIQRIPRTRYQAEETVAAQEWRNVPMGLRIPIDAPDTPEGCEVTITGVGPNSDPALVGKVFLLAEIMWESSAVERYFMIVNSQYMGGRAEYRGGG